MKYPYSRQFAKADGGCASVVRSRDDKHERRQACAKDKGAGKAIHKPNRIPPPLSTSIETFLRLVYR